MPRALAESAKETITKNKEKNLMVNDAEEKRERNTFSCVGLFFF
jgi:hypothetical protein